MALSLKEIETKLNFWERWACFWTRMFSPLGKVLESLNQWLTANIFERDIDKHLLDKEHYECLKREGLTILWVKNEIFSNASDEFLSKVFEILQSRYAKKGLILDARTFDPSINVTRNLVCFSLSVKNQEPEQK
jgi:hypothetical protein